PGTPPADGAYWAWDWPTATPGPNPPKFVSCPHVICAPSSWYRHNGSLSAPSPLTRYSMFCGSPIVATQWFSSVGASSAIVAPGWAVNTGPNLARIVCSMDSGD